jgi:hypothetical protein
MKYQRIEVTLPNGEKGFTYTKNNKMTNGNKIPHEVVEKFEYTNVVEYDEQPDKRRCLFCDAPQSRQKYLNGQLYDLCEWHYQNTRLGQLAAQVVAVAKENEKALAKEQAEADARKAKWHASHDKKKKKSRKTALSAAIS